jgi:hypothetical protein
MDAQSNRTHLAYFDCLALKNRSSVFTHSSLNCLYEVKGVQGNMCCPTDTSQSLKTHFILKSVSFLDSIFVRSISITTALAELEQSESDLDSGREIHNAVRF